MLRRAPIASSAALAVPAPRATYLGYVRGIADLQGFIGQHRAFLFADKDI